MSKPTKAKKEALARFFLLRKHLARVERAILNCMVDLYGGENEAEEVCRLSDYKAFVLSDLERETIKAYHAARHR